MKLFFLIAILFCNLCHGCTGIKSDTTPAKYKYKTLIKEDKYKAHTSILKDSIRFFIKEKKFAYYPKENDTLTQIIIDTILYSPKYDKAAFFVITQNSNAKSLNPGNANEYHYDAHCFIANYSDSNNFYNIFWLDQSSLSNYHNLGNTRRDIRDLYFKDFKTRQDGYGNSLYKYNIDDIRFWDGPVWIMYFDK